MEAGSAAGYGRDVRYLCPILLQTRRWLKMPKLVHEDVSCNGCDVSCNGCDVSCDGFGDGNVGNAVYEA